MKFFIVILFISNLLSSQTHKDFEFISPKPGSTFNTLESTIIIREGSVLNPATVNRDILKVSGSKSIEIDGNIVLSSDKRTIIFKPHENLQPGEKISVTVLPKLKTVNGQIISGTSFTFSVAPFERTLNPYQVISELKPNFGVDKNKDQPSSLTKYTKSFPTTKVKMYNEVELDSGYIFLAVASETEGIGYYLMMMNNDGTPYWSKELSEDYAYDFKMQPNGQVTYAQFIEHHSYTGGGNVIHKVLDHNTLEEIDQVQMGNGYIAEAHDFQILSNGHYLLFGYYLTEADLSELVDGGYPNALISGGVVQELDSEKNVVFQWRSWDYYDFETYDLGNRANNQTVSLFHLNTINLDVDNNIIIGTPTWVKKINRQTGEIMWKLGDYDNEFSFVNCDAGYIGGHMIHRIFDDHFLIYDNGNRKGTTTSQVHEFIIDEENKTCELFWSYIPDTLISGWHRGNATRLPNGNTAIGWGGSSGKYSPTYTEVNSNGDVLMEMFFDPYTVESYRAFRFPFTGGIPPYAEAIETEVVTGNTYNFIDDETGDMGISIKVINREGQGYNELIGTRYNFAPLNPIFHTKAPQVLPKKFILSQFGITNINAEISFDTEIWGINDPANSLIYQREFENSGLFVPLTSTYNHITEKLTVITQNFGEFIITTQDLESIVLQPYPFYPINNGSINQELDVVLKWNPIGYVNSYSLQVALDSNFSDLVVNVDNFKEALYVIDNIQNETTYLWRVKSANDAGESDWSDIQIFSTEPPFITILNPAENEPIQIGYNYFIKWEDNIEEDVIISIYKNENHLSVIDTAKSDRSYNWVVYPSLDLATDYAIKIESVNNPNIYSTSSSFSLIDTITTVVEYEEILPDSYKLYQNYPNPFNPSTNIEFAIPMATHVKLIIYDLLGNEIISLINENKAAGLYSITVDATNFASGVYIYRLVTDNFIDTKKMILMK